MAADPTPCRVCGSPLPARPWGVSGPLGHCCVCDFVYSGSEGEAMHPATKEQRERYEATRRAQRRLGGNPDAQRQAGIDAIKALREVMNR